MIDWIKTASVYGITGPSECKLQKTKICVLCDICKVSWDITYRTKTKAALLKTGDYYTRCTKCASKDPAKIEKIRSASLKLWQNEEYIARNLTAVRSESNIAKLSERAKNQLHTEESNLKASTNAKKQWEDPAFRELVVKSSKGLWENKALADQMLASRNTEEYKNNQRAKAKERWIDPGYRAKQEKANWTRSPERLAELRRSQPKVSKPQSILYSILDDLGVKYFREYNDSQDDPECTIGPYSFDCVIPRSGQKTLLVECHGDYWHSLKKNDSRDKAKETYINKYFADKYEIKVLWEHQMLSKDYAVSCLKQWMGIDKIDVVDFEFASVEIRKPPADEYRPLLSKYHYLVNAGRSGIVYGAYVNDTLTAVIVYSPPIRQNYDAATVKELSRLCIHPAYQKKNFASWLIGKTLRLLPKEIHTVVSFADSTFNHVGTIYKASNFKLDGEVKPDYWYVNDEGWVMHKKTLYNHAVRMGCKEREYAISHGYVKVWGKKKFRYIYNR